MSILLVNDRQVSLAAPSGRALLDVLRRDCGLTSIKEGCREGDCGACLAILAERRGAEVRFLPLNTCLTPFGDAVGRQIVTLEGLNRDELTPLQQALLEEGGSQCGFCTPGIIIAVTAYLLNAEALRADEAILAAAGNLCRCTGYLSVKRAIRRLAERFSPEEFAAAARTGTHARLRLLAKWRILPDYFTGIPDRLAGLPAAASGPLFPLRKAAVVAGGTDLYVQQGDELDTRPDIRLLSGREELRQLTCENSAWTLGGGLTMQDLERSPELAVRLPRLKDWMELIAAPGIRARATVAGNLVNASPIGDLTIILLALGASVVLHNGSARREVPLHRFFLGYKQLDKQPDELVEAVRFAAPPSGAAMNFEKVSRRKWLDIASVNSSAYFEVDHGRIRAARLAAGGVAPVPLFLEHASAWLAGRSIDAQTMRGAADQAAAESSPITDVRGSAEYKRRLLRHLVFAHFLRLFPTETEGFTP